jgi:hypothetical protein
MQLYVVIVNNLAVVNLKPVHMITRCFVQFFKKMTVVYHRETKVILTIKRYNAFRIKALRQEFPINKNCMRHFLPIFSRITTASSVSFRISRFYQKEI